MTETNGKRPGRPPTVRLPEDDQIRILGTQRLIAQQIDKLPKDSVLHAFLKWQRFHQSEGLDDKIQEFVRDQIAEEGG